MSSPVIYVGGDDLLFHAVGVMRKNNFTHIPVLSSDKKVMGVLNLAEALSAELGSTMSQIDSLTQDEHDVQGLINIKKYQPILVESFIRQSDRMKNNDTKRRQRRVTKRRQMRVGGGIGT